jgi:hypothetical protein
VSLDAREPGATTIGIGDVSMTAYRPSTGSKYG